MPRTSVLISLLPVALLSAAFLLVGSASAAAPPPAGQVAPPDPSQAASVPGPDCAKPPMGTHALLQDDAEVSVLGTGGSFGLSYDEYDNPVGGTALSRTHTSFPCDPAVSTLCGTAATSGAVTYVYSKDPSKPAGIPIVAFRDKNSEVALGTVTDTAVRPGWYCFPQTGHPETTGCKGSTVAYLSAASGDIDGAFTTDLSNEVVLAYRDNNSDLMVQVVRADQITIPNFTTANSIYAYYGGDTTYGRGAVSHVAVATGDLDGDGHKNEIVAAFKDGNKDLQVMIFKMQSASTLPAKLQVLWWKNFTDFNRGNVDLNGYAKRAIEVAAGDLDGDFNDEVVVGFLDGYNPPSTSSCAGTKGHVQLLVLNRNSDGTYDSNTWADISPPCVGIGATMTPRGVAVDVGDFDGNGRAEAAVAYTTLKTWCEGYGTAIDCYSAWNVRASSYKYVAQSDPAWAASACFIGNTTTPRDCLNARSGSWSDASSDPGYVALAAGDLDRNGKAEIAISTAGTANNSVVVNTFNASSGFSKRTGAVNAKGSSISGLALAMGDVEKPGTPGAGDAVWGTYLNQCRNRHDTHVQAVIHAPPFWSAYNGNDTDAGYGKSGLVGGGSGVSTETTYGASLTVGVEFAGVSSSFTYEFEKSCAVEQTTMKQTVSGAKFSTVPPSNNPTNFYHDAVAYDACPNWCYDYRESGYNTVITACVPRPQTECIVGSARLNYWYDPNTWSTWAPTDFANSWVPVGMNFARGKAAQQSTTASGGAAVAVDGNTKGSVTQTLGDDPRPSWQVDTVISPTIQAIQVWGPAQNFYVFVSPKPFMSNELNTLLTDSTIWHYGPASTTGGLATIFHGDLKLGNGAAGQPVVGRYVRVQMAGPGALSLAEVQVWGLPGDVDRWPRGESDQTGPVKVNNTSFKIMLPDGSYQTVDGQLAWSWGAAGFSVTAAGGAGYDTSSSEEYERMTSGSTSGTATVGMGVKTIEGSVSSGTTNTTSRSMTWGTQTEFEGMAGLLEDGTAEDLANHKYVYKPYIWMQNARSSGGVDQAYLVQDYWVPSIGNVATEPGEDKTPPMVLIERTPDTPDGAHGWYTGAVMLQVKASDNTEVIGVRCALDPQLAPATYDDLPQAPCPFWEGAPVSADGTHTLYAAAVDAAGNKSEVVSTGIGIDATPPIITCPEAGPFLLGSGEHLAGPAGVDAAVSGLDEGHSILTLPVTTDTVGPKTLAFAATDMAGNEATEYCTYNVIFAFGGFYPPVEPAPTLNKAKAGQAVPIKFSLGGDQGPAVMEQGYPVSQKVDCTTLQPPSGTPDDGLGSTRQPGQSRLSYDPGSGSYSYVWKTDKTWRSTCRQLSIKLADGTEHPAYFDFR